MNKNEQRCQHKLKMSPFISRAGQFQNALIMLKNSYFLKTKFISPIAYNQVGQHNHWETQHMQKVENP